MADFTSPTVLESHLATTFAPISTPTRLTGGFANFTFRCTLLSDGTSVIVKHAEPFAAFSPTAFFDPIRCFFEFTALSTPLPSTNAVTTPKALHYDSTNHILITADAGPSSVDLKSLLFASSSRISPTLGNELGVFLSTLHTWGRTAAASSLRESLGENTQATMLWRWCTYGRLLSTIPLFPGVLTPHTPLFEAVAAGGGEKGEETVVHGDFWCGNIILGGERAVVVDWEMARLGGVWEDIAQMCAEIFLTFHFHGREEAVEVLSGFLCGYGEVDEETAGKVVVHFGVHLVVWPCRIPWWKGESQMERCVAIGAEFIARGWRKDWRWVRGSVLRAVVREEWIGGGGLE